MAGPDEARGFWQHAHALIAQAEGFADGQAVVVTAAGRAPFGFSVVYTFIIEGRDISNLGQLYDILQRSASARPRCIACTRRAASGSRSRRRRRRRMSCRCALRGASCKAFT